MSPEGRKRRKVNQGKKPGAKVRGGRTIRERWDIQVTQTGAARSGRWGIRSDLAISRQHQGGLAPAHKYVTWDTWHLRYSSSLFTKKIRWNRQNKYLAQYIQNIIILTCNQYKKLLMRYFTFFFPYCLWNPVSISHLTRISILTSHLDSAGRDRTEVEPSSRA